MTSSWPWPISTYLSLNIFLIAKIKNKKSRSPVMCCGLMTPLHQWPSGHHQAKTIYHPDAGQPTTIIWSGQHWRIYHPDALTNYQRMIKKFIEITLCYISIFWYVLFKISLQWHQEPSVSECTHFFLSVGVVLEGAVIVYDTFHAKKPMGKKHLSSNECGMRFSSTNNLVQKLMKNAFGWCYWSD